MKVEDLLIEGEVYYNNNWIFIHTKGNYEINNRNTALYTGENKEFFPNKIASIKGINSRFDSRLATLEEKHWLNCCIQANQFVSEEEAMKSFKEEKIKFMVGNWYKCKWNFGGGLDLIFKFKSKTIDNKVIDVYSYKVLTNNSFSNNGSFVTEELIDIKELTSEKIQEYLPEDHPDKIGINLKTIKTKFEKGDYIVDFRTNNCYKLGSGGLVYFGSAYYCTYYVGVVLGFSEKSKWRYANQKEIEKYDEQGTYYNIDILNKEEKWIPKVGEWVIFIPEVAKKLGYHTECWNKPYILKIDRLDNNSLCFSNEQMKKAGYIDANAECSNSISCFRKALDYEIPKKYNSNDNFNDLVEEAINRGFIKGAKFIDLVNKSEFIIKDTNFQNFKDYSVLYIDVEENNKFSNKSARIWKNGNWSSIIKENPKLEIKVGSWYKVLWSRNTYAFIKVSNIMNNITEYSELMENKNHIVKDCWVNTTNIIEEIEERFVPYFNNKLGKIPEYIIVSGNYFIEKDQIGKIYKTSDPFPNYLQNCNNLEWNLEIERFPNVFKSSTKEAFEAQNTKCINEKIKIFEKYSIFPYSTGIDPYQDTSTKEKCHMINISTTVPVITFIKDNDRVSILKANKSKKVKIYSINN